MAAERLDDLVHLRRREPQREQRLVQGLVLLEADRDAREARARRPEPGTAASDGAVCDHLDGGLGRDPERIRPAAPTRATARMVEEAEPGEDGGEAAAAGQIVGAVLHRRAM